MSEFELAEILRPELAEVRAYVPHPGAFSIRLDANEAPPLLSQQARAKLSEAAATVAWERYPDATAHGLRELLAAHSGVSLDEILVGVGSDELIALLLTAASRPCKATDGVTIVTNTPSFVMYRLSARVRGIRALEVPLDEDWDLALEAWKSAVNFGHPNLIFIATPNNPTGNLMSRDRLERIIEQAPRALVVVDEAYIEYAPSDHLELYRKYENVAVLRTLSKVGFAALRLGWLIGRPALLREVDKVRQPYNVNSITQKLASVVLQDLWPEVLSSVRTVMAERERLAREIGQVPGLSVTPSHSNFLWVQSKLPAVEWLTQLAGQGISVRSFHERGGRLAQQLRITVGTSQENDALLTALRSRHAQ